MRDITRDLKTQLMQRSIPVDIHFNAQTVVIDLKDIEGFHTDAACFLSDTNNAAHFPGQNSFDL
ncbi:hypothetical protein SDC9_120871 [bioreactor metagenome]|uniref:Uncharacterized protein n=1 Tax=bioreactor metagenome TaxID=1076179 RepID=A0A645CAC8_9ZZZZ